MKKLLTIAMMTAAVSALAVESSNTFGILRVDSTAAQTIVSIPWEGAGASGQSANKIMVKDVVKTANLTKGTIVDGNEQADGDMLYLYTEGSYYAWYLSSEGVWAGIQTVANNGLPAAASDDTKKISRGDAIVLVRKDPSQPFYLYGQYAASGTTTTISRSEVGLTYALIAPATTTEVGVNSATWTNVESGDLIYLANGKTLYWGGADSKWCTKTFNPSTKKNELTSYSNNLEVGTGFWLCVGKGDSDVTVEW